MVTDTTLSYPPGPTTAEARKTFVAFRRNPLQFWCDLHAQYGDFAHFTLGEQHLYAIRDPHIIREVLVDKNALMRRTDVTWESLGRFMGEGLVISHGETHRRRRAIIQPAFTPSWINGYLPEIKQCTEDLLLSWKDGEVRNIADDMTRLALRILYRTVFGADTGPAVEQIQHAIATIQAYSAERMQTGRVTMAEYEVQQTADTLNNAIDMLIAHRRGDGQHDLLSLLVGATTDGQHLSEKEIREEALTFFLAGHETSANALAWTWYLLGSHPDVMESLHAEVDSVTSGSPVTLDHMAQLRYTDKVIREALRLYPPAWIISRTPLEPVEVGGYPVGTNVMLAICIYALHRNEAVFSEPEQFNPARFSTEFPRYTYLPFGGGPHVCIGQPLAMLEMVAALATIVQHWDIRVDTTQTVTPDPLMTLCPHPGVPVTVHQR